MASDLIKRVQGKAEGRKLEIIVNDVMKTELPPVDVCISNTPYQVRQYATGIHIYIADQCSVCVDILPPRLQATFTKTFTTCLRSHVSARIRTSSRCAAW
jgi:hypothetical protein